MDKKNKLKRGFSEKMKLYHVYNKRTGLYTFLLKNFIKLILILGGIVALLLIANKILLSYGIDLNQALEAMVNKLPVHYALLVFYLSESILGWLPPDIFIIWGKSAPTTNLILNITILGTISYLGGITAYKLGELIQRFPKMHAYIERKYAKNFELIQKWGGVVIVMAALFPLPFATISTIAGIVKYPFKPFVLYGLTRYLRFYIYAAGIFGVLGSM